MRVVPAVERWLTPRRWLLDVGVLSVTAVTTAILGFWIPEVWPGAESQSRRHFDVGHSLALVLSLAALVAVVLWRWRLRVAHGTLYYVRFLSGWMSDWHLASERDRRRHFLDERVVSRQILGSPCDGVWDLASEVDQLARDLQMTMNDDDVSTGFLLAPNLLWPAAVALGYQLHPWPELQLTEFENPDRAMTFELHGSDEFAGFDVPTTLTKGNPGSTVLLTVEMTGQGAVTLPPGFQPSIHIRLCMPSGEGMHAAGRRVIVATSAKRSNATAGSALAHPTVVAVKTAEAIAKALDDYPDATVYSIMRIPKSVAVAIGHRMSGLSADVPPGTRPPTPSRATRHAWQRLVLLVQDQDAVGDKQDCYFVARVHRSQPPATELAATAKSHGLVLSGAKP